jgi:hypothetical protein
MAAQILGGTMSEAGAITLQDKPVLQVSFDLGWKQLGAAIVMITTAIGGAAGAGWLVMPASKTDLTVVEQKLQTQVTSLQDIRKELVELQNVNGTMTDAVRELRLAVAELREGGFASPADADTFEAPVPVQRRPSATRPQRERRVQKRPLEPPAPRGNQSLNMWQFP